MGTLQPLSHSLLKTGRLHLCSASPFCVKSLNREREVLLSLPSPQNVLLNAQARGLANLLAYEEWCECARLANARQDLLFLKEQATLARSGDIHSSNPQYVIYRTRQQHYMALHVSPCGSGMPARALRVGFLQVLFSLV